MVDLNQGKEKGWKGYVSYIGGDTPPVLRILL